MRELERELERARRAAQERARATWPTRSSALLERSKEQQREIEQLKRKLLSGGGARDLDGGRAGSSTASRVLGAMVDIGDPKALRELADQLRDKLAPAVIVLGARRPDGRALLVVHA